MRSTRITDIAIIHSKTSFVGYRGRGVISITRIYSAGEACLAPTKPCGGKAIDVIYCSYRARTRITLVMIIHSKTSLSVIAGEACLAAYKALPLQGSPLPPVHSHSSLSTSNFLLELLPTCPLCAVPFFLLLCGVVAGSFFCFVPSDAFETPPLKGQ